MSKEINEKTFELNITNELINTSKSFIWYLTHFYWHSFPLLNKPKLLKQFFSMPIIFSEGLTQKEESEFGYDVSIHYKHQNGLEGRLLFLQYKAGLRRLYCKNESSCFHERTTINNNSTVHALFTFNNNGQHSKLRVLANKENIKENSVLYVFPRITEKDEFYSKAGSLINFSSFVPVLEIDRQASNQNPSIEITDEIPHNYRTSYDGKTSEINYYYYYYYYDIYFAYKLLSELICIQIERFAILMFDEGDNLIGFKDSLLKCLTFFVNSEINNDIFGNIIIKNVSYYIMEFGEFIKSKDLIPRAPDKYTTILPIKGLNITYNEQSDLSSICYHIF